ncbi:MAG TPA: CbiX/SirB N-terminal domain-containing protein [Nitrospirota bacterium]|nr:CbiX/SirB N-terminal domain-containing protein [Nitrospirota bacterium]
MKTAVIILGHGSHSGGADETVKRVAAEVKESGCYEIVVHAFLQYTTPTPQNALENCIRHQAQKIVIVPFFMQPGAHVTRDIPELVDKARKLYPDLDIVVTDYVGAHPLMAKIVEDLVDKTKQVAVSPTRPLREQR